MASVQPRKENIMPAGEESSDDEFSSDEDDVVVVHSDSCLKLRDKLDTLSFNCKCGNST